jgi:hypothetical protein
MKIVATIRPGKINNDCIHVWKGHNEPIFKNARNILKGGVEMGIRKSNGGGEYNQSISYACV